MSYEQDSYIIIRSSPIFLVTSQRRVKLSKPVNLNESHFKQVRIPFKSYMHV